MHALLFTNGLSQRWCLEVRPKEATVPYMLPRVEKCVCGCRTDFPFARYGRRCSSSGYSRYTANQVSEYKSDLCEIWVG